jgi:hypothetical protein
MNLDVHAAAAGMLSHTRLIRVPGSRSSVPAGAHTSSWVEKQRASRHSYEFLGREAACQQALIRVSGSRSSVPAGTHTSSWVEKQRASRHSYEFLGREAACQQAHTRFVFSMRERLAAACEMVAQELIYLFLSNSGPIQLYELKWLWMLPVDVNMCCSKNRKAPNHNQGSASPSTASKLD